MRAGSMLTEAMRPTWRISLAIILSFSKFTRPSTLESLPEKQGKKESEYQLLTRYTADKTNTDQEDYSDTHLKSTHTNLVEFKGGTII